MITNFIILLYLSAVWGTAFTLIKIGEETIAPVAVQAGRASIGFLSLLALSLILRKDLAGHARYAFAFLVFSILGVSLLWILAGIGQEYITAGLTSVMVSTTPLVTFVIMVFILREESFTIYGIAGLLTGVAGLVLVIGIENITGGGATLKGVLLIGGGFAVFAINGVLAPKLATGADPIVSTTYYMGFASAILWAFALIFESPLKIPLNEKNLLVELALGVICTASGFASYYYLLNKAGAFFSSMTFYFIPVFGIVAGMLILEEKITASQVIGIAVVFTGVYLINREKFKKGQDPPNNGSRHKPGMTKEQQ